jgi:hypothetical protein
MKRFKFTLLSILVTFAASLQAECTALYTDPHANIDDKNPLVCERSDLSKKEAALINHVKFAIHQGDLQLSKLNPKILKIEGMSTSKTRCFLNALCSLPGTKYLEIGCWKGSTFISALYKNKETLDLAIGIDNWSEFEGPREDFIKHCKKFLKKIPYQFYSQDCFSVDPTLFIKKKINTYFYDGNHSPESQAQAFLFFNPILEDLFVTIIDDWNWDSVRQGTYEAFSALNYTILYEAALPARYNQDQEMWWNGLYVAVIRKNPNF